MSRHDPLGGDTEQLVRRVYAYVAYRIGAGTDADDVTSETFVRALRYWSSYDARRGGVEAWLIGIARRCIVDHVTAAGRSVEESGLESIPQSALGDTSGDPESLMLERVALRRAVAQLSERDRELVALRYGADLSARQIAAVLDTTTNAVEVALHRALQRLRGALDPAESEDASQQGPILSP